MNPASDHFSSCYCKRIIDDLLKFVKEIISDFGEEERKKCEIYAQQCLCRNVSVIRDTDEFYRVSKLCSHELCSLLVKELPSLDPDFNFKLSTIITNFIIYVYERQCCLYNENSYSLKYTFVESCIHEIRSPDSMKVFRILTVLNGRYKVMKALVKLGLVSSVKNNLKWKIKDIKRNIQYFISLCMGADYPENSSMLDNIIKSTKSICFHNTCNEIDLRMLLATVAIQAAYFNLQMEENTARDYIRCIRLFFVTTNSPLLTINEVRSMLYVCLHYLKKLDIFESYSEAIVKLMPECSANYQPRNLTDLVRFKIRETLKKCNLPLPAAVEKLDLPRPLKKFVLSDITKMSRNRGNVFSESFITMSQLAGRLFEGELFESERLERHSSLIEI